MNLSHLQLISAHFLLSFLNRRDTHHYCIKWMPNCRYHMIVSHFGLVSRMDIISVTSLHVNLISINSCIYRWLSGTLQFADALALQQSCPKLLDNVIFVQVPQLEDRATLQGVPVVGPHGENLVIFAVKNDAAKLIRLWVLDSRRDLFFLLN